MPTTPSPSTVVLGVEAETGRKERMLAMSEVNCIKTLRNEKGHVEGKVGYVRYNFFSLPPVIKDLEDLTAQLEQQLINDRQRIHYEKEVLIDELWQQEQKQLIKLPEEPYPVFKQFSITFNKYNEFKLDGHLIHVPKAKNYVQLSCVTYWDSYKVITNDGEILLSDARPYMKNVVLFHGKIF